MEKHELELIESMIDIAHPSLKRIPIWYSNNPASVAKLLNHAADEFGRHGCNDVDEIVYKDWTIEQRIKFVKEFHVYNGDSEDYTEGFLSLPDYALMGFLAHKLEREKKEERIKKIKSIYE